MRKQRVVITGMGAVSPYGRGVGPLMAGMYGNVCAIRLLPEYQVQGLACRAASLVPPLDASVIPRNLRRTMSPMSIFAYFAACEAMEQAGLNCDPILPRMGTVIGSTLGSPQVLHEFFAMFLQEQSVENMRSSVFFKVMGHSVAANVALACGCTGRTLAPAAACASGLMAICLGYEAIAAGREDVLLCGGADEFHLLTAATFDRLGAASHEAVPESASRPFDVNRSGIVCGEGAGILLLESLDSALARKAHILAEIKGSAIASSPANIAHPDALVIADCIQQALQDAALPASTVGYINAHATATEYGDIAEGQAIQKIFGSAVPVSSLKGHLGHTMAACGALESIACIAMLRESVYFPTLNLTNPDMRCGEIAHIKTQTPFEKGVVIKNSFALGGCNCTVIFDNFYE